MGIMETLQTHYTDPTSIPSFSSQRSLQSIPSLTSSSTSIDQDNYQTHSLIHTFTPHSAPISSIAVSGHLLFTGSSAPEIGSWAGNLGAANDVSNFTFAAGHGAVKWLAVAGTRLFSAHQDHKIRVWQIEDHSSSSSSSSRNKSYSRVATLPTLGDRATKLLTPGSQVTIRRHKKSTWVHHVDAVSALAPSPDGSLLYSVSWDRALKVWRTADFRCLESIRDAHDDAINAVAVSPDGHVYTGSTDKKIKVWRTSTPRLKNNKTSTNIRGTGIASSASTASVSTSFVTALEKHNSGVNALAISEDGSVLYSGAGDRSVVVWERGVGEECMVVLGALRGHSKAILCLAVVNDLVCSGSADKTVRVWRGVQRRYSCVAVLTGHTGPVKCLTAVIDPKIYDDDDDDEVGCLVYSGGLDCEVKVWKIVVPDSF